jgi:hypothetical protein
MRKQTTHTSFEPSDMKDYAYMVVARLNPLIKGKAEPEYDRAGIWYIKVSFNNFNFKYRGDLSQYFYYKFDIDLVARIIRNIIIKEIVDSVVTEGNNVDVITGKEY